MVPGKIVAVEGASAAGKTTALAAVAEATGWTVVPEAYRRITPTPSLQFHSAAELLDLERRLLEEDARRAVLPFQGALLVEHAEDLGDELIAAADRRRHGPSRPS